MVNQWANFLANEKLKVGGEGTLVLIDLATELAKRGTPARRPYMARIASRQLIVNTAMDLGIDLPGLWPKLGRGLLEVWLDVYTHRYGGIYGTNAWAELKRRGIVTKLVEERKRERSASTSGQVRDNQARQ
jgi:hypothetical protein